MVAHQLAHAVSRLHLSAHYLPLSVMSSSHLNLTFLLAVESSDEGHQSA